MPRDLNLSMFRAYDIRTPSSRLPAELCRRLADAEAVYFRDVLEVSGVIVAHDARSTGPAYLTIVTDALRDAGLDVIYLPGVSSTSLFYFAAMRYPAYAAVMVGASHNPAGDTGQKILADDVAPVAAGIGPEGGLLKIREFYEAHIARGAARRGRLRTVDLLREFVEYSMGLAEVEEGSLQGTRILFDFLFGAAGRELMVAFERAGADLTPLHFVPDGSFPLGDPNPVKQRVIKEGIATLQNGDFDLAAFFDGDGDRIDIYRGDGSYVSSSFVYAAVLPLIRAQIQSQNLGVFADLKSNPRALIEMAKNDVSVDVVRNGHSQIKQSMINDPCRFGAVEESAHFYQAFTPSSGQRFCTENTLYFALLIARAWNEDAERFEELFRMQNTTARQREWGYKFPGEEQMLEALAATKQHFESQGARSMERMKNGMDLEATLMRIGLPFNVDQHTKLGQNWLQVCQRTSQSEDRLARWEAVGDNPDLVRQAKNEIAGIVQRFGAGDEYQG
jgi:phosphomannomutase